MQTFLVEHNVLFALICGLLAVAYGAYLTRWVLQQSPGNERMREIQAAIQEGASAYLNRQYRTVGVVAVVVAALLLVAGIWSDDLGWKVALGFIIGAVLSAVAGYVGMNTAVRANARVAEAGRTGLAEAFDVAFKGGTVTGILVVGLGLLGVAGYYGVLRAGGVSETSAVHALVGLSFGGSLISVFARLGGGIFTKGADVGADLVGKIEAGIPEDDPRNPAVIADNVGDNVGDDAGMAADLFETYAVTLVAGMLLAQQAGWGAAGLGIPLVLGGISIIASIIGTQFVKVRGGGSVMGALYKGVVVTAGISALVFIPVMNWMVDKIPVAHESWGRLYLCALVGLVITALLMVITEYYTGTRWGPVKRISEASTTGHATNIIAGPRQVDGGHGGPRARDRHRHPRRLQARRHHGHRPGGRRDALAGRHDRRARRVRADHRQRGRHRRDGGHARVGARHHRPARRRRQHDEGRHEGLRDRLGRPRRPRALRLLLARAGAEGRRRREDGQRRLLDLEPVGARRAPDRRDHALPLRLARDGGRRPRRAPRSCRRCAASSARSRGSWRAPRSPSTRSASTSSRAARSRRCGSRR